MYKHIDLDFIVEHGAEVTRVDTTVDTQVDVSYQGKPNQLIFLIFLCCCWHCSFKGACWRWT